MKIYVAAVEALRKKETPLNVNVLFCRFFFNHTLCMTKLTVLLPSFADFTDISIIPSKLDFSETPEIVCFFNVIILQTPAPPGSFKLKKTHVTGGTDWYFQKFKYPPKTGFYALQGCSLEVLRVFKKYLLPAQYWYKCSCTKYVCTT